LPKAEAPHLVHASYLAAGFDSKSSETPARLLRRLKGHRPRLSSQAQCHRLHLVFVDRYQKCMCIAREGVFAQGGTDLGCSLGLRTLRLNGAFVLSALLSDAATLA
jgi:hypothetical protein